MSCQFCNLICGCQDGYIDFDPFVPEWDIESGLRYHPNYEHGGDPIGNKGTNYTTIDPNRGWRIVVGFVDMDHEDRASIPIKFCPWCGTELPEIDKEAFEFIQQVIPKYGDELDLDEVMGLRYQTHLETKDEVPPWM